MGNQLGEGEHSCSDNISFGREGREFRTGLSQTIILLTRVGLILINNNFLKVAASAMGSCCVLTIAVTEGVSAS